MGPAARNSSMNGSDMDQHHLRLERARADQLSSKCDSLAKENMQLQEKVNELQGTVFKNCHQDKSVSTQADHLRKLVKALKKQLADEKKKVKMLKASAGKSSAADQTKDLFDENERLRKLLATKDAEIKLLQSSYYVEHAEI